MNKMIVAIGTVVSVCIILGVGILSTVVTIILTHLALSHTTR